LQEAIVKCSTLFAGIARSIDLCSCSTTSDIGAAELVRKSSDEIGAERGRTTHAPFS
jgi:hypothetical protein